ncbi:MAG: UDP-N-acetylmuramoyl-tripeptide--D-alanyl-D-alanine ligase [Mariprofundaceae bacterium]|nr:UDP-N-acetylmuramoyl-tripeptide--D-alanyl-D-alanine ligase [Mariprofundaceae bacterium]
MYLSALELQQATQGKWHHRTPGNLRCIKTDSRHFEHGDAFLALHGPHFDGHHYAHGLDGKACAFIGDHQGVKGWSDLATPQLEVQNTQFALGDIAHAWRKKLRNTTIVAITGSYGKTTVRSMLVHVFDALGMKTTATKGNLNNLIGVPMTLLGIPDDTDIAFIECGISEIGEMQRLSEIVHPDIVIFTGITAAHSEGLGGLRGVIYEKTQLLNHLSDQGWCALGHGVGEQLRDIHHHHCMGICVGYHMLGSQLTLSYGDEQASLSLPLPAAHWGENMAFVASIALQYTQRQQRCISLTELTKSLASWQPVQGRLQSISGINGCLILDDSYNANPVTMQAALHTLAAMPSRRIAILGDMAELGDVAISAHKQLDASQCDLLILVGKNMHGLYQQQAPSASLMWFANTDDFLAWVTHDFFTAQDTILIKASRSMRFDKIVSALNTDETFSPHAMKGLSQATKAARFHAQKPGSAHAV